MKTWFAMVCPISEPKSFNLLASRCSSVAPAVRKALAQPKVQTSEKVPSNHPGRWAMLVLQPTVVGVHVKKPPYGYLGLDESPKCSSVLAEKNKMEQPPKTPSYFGVKKWVPF